MLIVYSMLGSVWPGGVGTTRPEFSWAVEGKLEVVIALFRAGSRGGAPSPRCKPALHMYTILRPSNPSFFVLPYRRHPSYTLFSLPRRLVAWLRSVVRPQRIRVVVWSAIAKAVAASSSWI